MTYPQDEGRRPTAKQHAGPGDGQLTATVGAHDTAGGGGTSNGAALAVRADPATGEILDRDDIRALTDDDLGRLADRAWQASTVGILTAADCCAEAHRRFGVSAGRGPFPEWERWISERHFGARTARRLVAIATDGRIRTHVSELPPSWGTLYRLTRLSDDALDDGIATGTISPGMERGHADALLFADKQRATNDTSRAALADVASVPATEFTPRLITADVLDGLESLPAQSVDLIVTDPPYNMNKAEWDSYGSGSEFADWCEPWLRECLRVLKTTGNIYVFGTPRMLSHVQHRMDRLGFRFRNWIVWDTIMGSGGKLWVNRHEDILYYSKSGTAYMDPSAVKLERHEEHVREYRGVEWAFKDPSNIWRFPRVDDSDLGRAGYVVQKPVELFERVVLASCPPGGTVLDPFAGTGTCLVAAMRHKRRSIGIDNNPDAVSICHRRLSDEVAG